MCIAAAGESNVSPFGPELAATVKEQFSLGLILRVTLRPHWWHCSYDIYQYNSRFAREYVERVDTDT